VFLGLNQGLLIIESIFMFLRFVRNDLILLMNSIDHGRDFGSVIGCFSFHCEIKMEVRTQEAKYTTSNNGEGNFQNCILSIGWNIERLTDGVNEFSRFHLSVQLEYCLETGHNNDKFFSYYTKKIYNYRLCGPLVRVPFYRSRGPGSIPGSTRFSEN
jgi:hypothetical protein